MRARKINFFAKILIFISIFIIAFGLVLQIKENTFPNLNNVIELEEENIISVTETDDEISDVVEEIPDEIIKEDEEENDSDTNSSVPNTSNDAPSKPSTPNSSSNSQPNSSSDSNSSSGNNSNNSSSSNNSSNSNSEVIEKPLTIEETNIKLRDSIQANYGVTIKFGYEASGYSVGGLSTTVISDPYLCQQALNNLNSALALYPSGFFNELSRNFNPLTFYLVKNYSKPSVTGVTSSYAGRVDISIAIDFGFGDTFHHEVYHYIEYYMKSKGYTYTSWNTLNPIDFSYGTINQSYSYDSTFSEDSYFVNSYAQTSAEEDRASTFEYMMSNNKASCLNNGKWVWSKAKAMSEAIDFYLDSVSPNVREYWERFVY